MDNVMKVTSISSKSAKPEAEPLGSVRATISFPAEQYAIIEEIAKQKKVSLAWVVRDAVDSYLDNKWPLFKQSEPEED
jgi:hypothetical protein